jgi:CheY-like chemotaxis protein
VRTICLIEDNPDNRLLVHAILDDYFVVIEHSDGPSALHGLKTVRVDLVLLDISLPVMDGITVLKHIRDDAELRELPVIALTAHAMAGDRARFLLEGFNDYVTKPIVDEQMLLGAIANSLA